MEKVITFEEELNQRGYLIYKNKGISMMPLLRENKDLIHIRKPNGRCRKYDVPLYKRGNQYVLHRILKVREDDYVICGDNCLHREYGIKDSDIIGVLEGVTRDGKYISVTDWKYRIYSFIWVNFFYVRVSILWLRIKCGALRRKLRGEKQ